MRVRLRHRRGAFLLGPGRYDFGRSPACSIVVSGTAVSRRHARLDVGPDSALLTDLESANGVFVNGLRIGEPVVLAAGDVIIIGSDEFSVVLEPDDQAGATASEPEIAVPVRDDAAAAAPESGDATAKTNAFELLGKVAERSLAAGSYLRAEAILRDRLYEVLNATEQTAPAEDVATSATEWALRLAAAGPSPKWLSYAIELLSATGRPCKSPELLEAALAAVPEAEEDRIRAYIALVRAMPANRDQVGTLAVLAKWAATH